MSRLKNKGKGKTITKKKYLLNFVERLMMNGEWANEVNDQLLKSRMEEWRQIKSTRDKGKGSGASSSSGISGAIASGAKSVGGAVVEAGKEGLKTLAVEGAKSAVMSLL